MFVGELDYSYPQDLVALEPARPCRVAFVNSDGFASELTFDQLLARFEVGDLLVINQSKVIPARVFARDSTRGSEIDVLFLRSLDANRWEVLFPASEFSIGDSLLLPDNVQLTLKAKGRPQTVELSRSVGFDYFTQFGEMALPPYIQAARGQRHHRPEDLSWYQSEWAAQPGSVAAPTASLHFRNSDLDRLRANGVGVANITLHVGAGTFLPISGQRLDGHTMHDEWVEIPASTLDAVQATRARGRRVWALGTTVARALESHALGLLTRDSASDRSVSVCGMTGLFVRPPFQFQMVDGLLTNFHQPKSTLLALVMAFAGDVECVKRVYAWAIERRFRLFSYGDLSAWIRP